MKKNIIVVEDNPVIASVYRTKLQAEGFYVEVAPDGLAGLKTIERVRPDLVLLDLVLPKMSGIEVLTNLRAQTDFQNLPVIVFSSSYVSDEAWQAGATRVLNKASHTPNQVVEEVKTLLAESQASASTANELAFSTPAPRVKPLNQEAEFQAEFQRTFRAETPETVSLLRVSLQTFIKTPHDSVNLNDLYRKLHAVSGNAGLSGLRQISLLAAPLEVLLRELSVNPQQINSSVTRTVVQAVELLISLFEDNSEQTAAATNSFNVLVVDDEEIVRRSVTYGLEKAQIHSFRVSEAQVALKVLSENRFDLLFIGIEMPGMNGLELCLKLRELPLQRETPIIFMTTLSQFEQYLQPALRGGNEIIAKPFHYTELVVKTLMSLLQTPRGKSDIRL